MSRQSGDSGRLLNILYSELIVFSVIIAVTDLISGWIFSPGLPARSDGIIFSFTMEREAVA